MSRPQLGVTILLSLLIGFFMGHTLKQVAIPEVVLLLKNGRPAESSDPHSKRLSQVLIDSSVKLTNAQMAPPILLTRYFHPDRNIYAVHTLPSQEWREDLVLGYADTTALTPDSKMLWQCNGTSVNAEKFTFYSMDPKCHGQGVSTKTGAYLRMNNPENPLFLRLDNCVRASSHIIYPSLNSNCESDWDAREEHLGYVRAAKIIAP